MDEYNKSIKTINLTVEKAIRKSFISWNIKLDKPIKVIYLWKSKNYKKLKLPIVTVDYNKYRREWYVNYIPNHTDIYSSTIDDITGQISITNST